MVFDDTKLTRASNVQVEVKNVVTKKKYKLTTNHTGRFVFTLKSGSRYRLTVMQKDGTIIQSQPFATINKKSGDLLHIIIQGNTIVPKKISQHLKTKSSSITYKIHIGAFTKPLAANSSFLMNLNYEFNTMTTTTGLTRYVVGDFVNLSLAEKHKVVLKNLGYKNAFIAVYKEEEWLYNWPVQQS